MCAIHVSPPCLSVCVASPMAGGLCPKFKLFFWSGACSPRRSVFLLGGVSAKMKRLFGGGRVPQDEASSAGGLCAKMKRLSGGGRVPQDAVVFIAF